MSTDQTTQPRDPFDIAAALTRAGLPAEVENTGGGVLVVTVAAADPAHGTVAVTWDGDAYMVGAYPLATWVEGESEDLAAHRRAPELGRMLADVEGGREFLADAHALTQPRMVQAAVAWQYRTHVEEPAGYVEVPVPGGALLVSVDHPTGVYGGFYLRTPDGLDPEPSPVMTGTAPLTFTNAGVWDVDRIVSALRGEHGPEFTIRILADYTA